MSELNKFVVLGVMIASLVTGTFGCGRPSEDAVNMEAGMIPVSQSAAFGTQCQLGTAAEPEPVSLGLWDCPVDMNVVNLEQAPKAFMLKADCIKKTLSIRTTDGTADTYWNLPANGEFDLFLNASEFSKDGNAVIFETDNVGAGKCVSYAQVNLWGKVDCSDRDNPRVDYATIDLKARWNLGKGKPTEDNPVRLRQCQLPSSCYMFAKKKLEQCG